MDVSDFSISVRNVYFQHSHISISSKEIDIKDNNTGVEITGIPLDFLVRSIWSLLCKDKYHQIFIGEPNGHSEIPGSQQSNTESDSEE